MYYFQRNMKTVLVSYVHVVYVIVHVTYSGVIVNEIRFKAQCTGNHEGYLSPSQGLLLKLKEITF